MPPKPTLTTLPLELIIHILAHLPTRSLLACTLTSHFFHHTITSTPRLQYALAKDKAGVEDFPYDRVPISKCLSLLQDRERAWNSFSYKFIRNIEVVLPSTEIYDLTRSAYFLGSGTRRDETHAIQYASLPRLQEDEVLWNVISVGKLVADFGLSIDENDLMALLCYTTSTTHFPPGLDIHLVHLPSNQPHPHALEPIIHVCNVEIDQGAPSITIDISGDILILCIDYPQSLDHRPLMYVYNWKSGLLKFKPTHVSNIGVVFLRHDIFILPNPNKFSLDAYYAPPSSTSLTDENPSLQPFETLLLPQLNDGIEVSTFIARGEPSPHDPSSPLRSSPSPLTTSSYTLPFRNRVQDALILFTIDTCYVLDQRPFESFAFVVHRDMLLGLVLPSLESFMHGSKELVQREEVLEWGGFSTLSWVKSNSEGEGEAGQKVELVLEVFDPESSQSTPTIASSLSATPTSTNNPTSPAAESNYTIDNGLSISFSNEIEPYPYHFSVAWSNWGPKITRWFSYAQEISEYITTTSGTRYVRLTPPVSVSSGRHIEVLDFGKGRVRDAISHNSIEERSLRDWELVTHPSTITPGDSDSESAFLESVVSFLPYIRTISKEVVDYKAVLIDEERIIGLKDSGEVRTFDILYFG
ncbi:hypothetical protein BDQ17DRAFT_1355651 [Cyathus striatus]|nr:hypothetical protein BDQ17DRAFT_1355651 [Cyathus striatus]